MNIKEQAKKIFSVYPDLKEIYITSDGFGFSVQTKAKEHARTLASVKVEKFENVFSNEEISVENIKKMKNFDLEIPEDLELVNQYKELHGAPPHNISREKLIEKITNPQES